MSGFQLAGQQARRYDELTEHRPVGIWRCGVGEMCAALERFRDDTGRYAIPFRSYRLTAAAA